MTLNEPMGQRGKRQQEIAEEEIFTMEEANVEMGEKKA